jgi:hypothetical protein
MAACLSTEVSHAGFVGCGLYITGGSRGRQAEATATVHALLRAGIKDFDTAPLYGSSEVHWCSRGHSGSSSLRLALLVRCAYAKAVRAGAGEWTQPV